jgi:NAD(P)H-dependent FMN reductase
VLRLAVGELEARGATVDVVDPRDVTLPLPGTDGDRTTLRMRETLRTADGVIFSTAEYHGTFTAVTKLIIENLGFPSALKGKPVVLLGVASGRIGAVKSLEHLRGVLAHVGAIVLPGPTSVANVDRAFDDDWNCVDSAMEKQVRGLGTNLLDYLHRHVCPAVTLEESVRDPNGD